MTDYNIDFTLSLIPSGGYYYSSAMYNLEFLYKIDLLESTKSDSNFDLIESLFCNNSEYLDNGLQINKALGFWNHVYGVGEMQNVNPIINLIPNINGIFDYELVETDTLNPKSNICMGENFIFSNNLNLNDLMEFNIAEYDNKNAEDFPILNMDFRYNNFINNSNTLSFNQNSIFNFNIEFTKILNCNTSISYTGTYYTYDTIKCITTHLLNENFSSIIRSLIPITTCIDYSMDLILDTESFNVSTKLYKFDTDISNLCD